MARSEGSSSGGASQLPKSEASAFTVSFPKTNIPRRQLTLLAITVCLNVLLWTSFFTFIATLYLLGTDAEDGTNLPTDILTLISFVVSIAYIAFHTIVSIKQKYSAEEVSRPPVLKRTSYIAIRLSVSLCVLWLLTCGWDLIIVARQPVCLPTSSRSPSWEAGSTCSVGRASVAMSLIALIASCTLFGMLAVVRRPFEAHLYKFSHKRTVQPKPTPFPSRRPSRSTSFASENPTYQASSHRSITPNRSNADVETLDLDSNSVSSIHSPSPVRSIGLGIFTSSTPPPAFPPSAIPTRRSSLRSTPTPPIFYPTASYAHLPPPPRMSALIAPSGFVPLSVPMSASAWRAVHPPGPSPLGPVASRSFPHLPHATGQTPYLNHHSRSMGSLTRPHRLSSAPAGSVTWSSRSGSIDEAGRDSPSTSTTRSATASPPSAGFGAGVILSAGGATVAIPSRTSSSGIRNPKTRGKGRLGHIRRASAPDANMAVRNGRWPKGWRPRLEGQAEALEHPQLVIPSSTSGRSASDSSKDNSPSEEKEDDFAKELELRLGLENGRPLRKSRSMSPLRRSDSFLSINTGAIGRSSTLKPPRQSTSSREAPKDSPQDHLSMKDMLNKPLPKIAAL